MRILRPALLALGLLCLPPAHADEPSPEKVADLRALFDLTGTSKLVDQILATTLQQLAPLLRNCQDCSERTAQIIEQETRQLFREGYSSPGGLLERQIEIYHRHLSHDDVRQLLQFYRSPIGQRLTQELPAITTEGYQAGREWAQALAPELRRRIGAAIELERLLDRPAATPAPETK